MLQRRRRYVLEFGSEGSASARHFVQGGGIVKSGAQMLIGYFACRAVAVGVQHGNAVAHLMRGDNEEAAELAASKHPQHGRRQDHGFSCRIIASTRSVCALRNAASFFASAASLAASMATANNPALAAPASPMAKVATGMPLGICTMDNNESCPCRCLEGTGTPSTGTVVLAAIIPGRCAAPPAPAMMARRPRLLAFSANSNSKSGVRCAETTLAS